jgi:hypothetical protein
MTTLDIIMSIIIGSMAASGSALFVTIMVVEISDYRERKRKGRQ